MSNIKDMVLAGKKVTFVRFEGGSQELWYVTDCGFEFPVPILDTAGATFLASDKAILFLRWIGKHARMLAEAIKHQDQ